jgi:hypothetical protein
MTFDVQHRDALDSLAACEGQADLVLTSPPYPDARSDAQYGGASFDTSVGGYGRLGDAVFAALKPGGVCVLNIDGPCRVWRPEIGESERSMIAWEVALDWAPDRRRSWPYRAPAGSSTTAAPRAPATWSSTRARAASPFTSEAWTTRRPRGRMMGQRACLDRESSACAARGMVPGRRSFLCQSRCYI